MRMCMSRFTHHHRWVASAIGAAFLVVVSSAAQAQAGPDAIYGVTNVDVAASAAELAATRNAAPIALATQS